MTLAWVTGASRGIGRATALALAKRRIELVLLSRDATRLDSLQREIEAVGAQAHLAEIDLMDATRLAQVCKIEVQNRGLPDVVINNAGVVQRMPIEATTLEMWDHQFNVNLRAPFVVTREVLPGMRSRGSGRIIQIASISATLGCRNAAAYAATKWGLLGFMKSLAEEIADSGLMTVAILPGSVDTDMLKGSGFAPRMTADDVANSIVHYALDAPISHNGGIIEMFGV